MNIFLEVGSVKLSPLKKGYEARMIASIWGQLFVLPKDI